MRYGYLYAMHKEALRCVYDTCTKSKKNNNTNNTNNTSVYTSVYSCLSDSKLSLRVAKFAEKFSSYKEALITTGYIFQVSSVISDRSFHVLYL